MMYKDNIDDVQKAFNLAWNKYWYEKKSFSDKLCDDMNEEHTICAKFMESLNELGLLDKAYIMKKIRKVM